MAVGIKQILSMNQSLVMTPQLQQAIKLLQLSRMELENLINTELVDNPILEESENSEATAQSMEDSMPDTNTKAEENPQEGENFNWDEYLENAQSTPSLPAYRKGEDELPTYENTLTAPPSLTDHLYWQLKMSTDLDDKQKEMGEALIGNINEDGYLQATLEEISEKEEYDVHDLEAVLYHVQSFDPLGVGARDLKECLMIQLDELKIGNENIERIIENHMGDLEKKNYSAIGKVLGLSLDSVIEHVKIIEELEPKPGRSCGGQAAHYIVPDIYVAKREGKYVVMLNEDGLPRLKISNFYKGLLDQAETAKGDTKEYIKGKLRSAVWLIRSIHQRQRTIFKVTESIVKHQTEFLDQGISALKPMVLRDVANDIGMHESTISRVTTNKFVHTPRGIFELKFFFNSGISRIGGADVASESVKEKVKEIIAKEDSVKPFSDQKIADILKKEDINIARRTVAKYREMLGILPSSKRRKAH